MVKVSYLYCVKNCKILYCCMMFGICMIDLLHALKKFMSRVSEDFLGAE